MATDVSSVTDHFPSPQDGFTTTLNGTISAGATTVNLNGTGNFEDGDTVVLIIDPSSTTAKQAFTGTMDVTNSRVTGVVWTSSPSGSDVGHTNGATIIDYVAATHVAMISKGIKNRHNDDGTHKAFTEADVIPTAAIQDDAVTPAKLGLTKVADANGWTVYDYGTFKKYTKRFTGTFNVAAAGTTTLVNGQACPVGFTTWADYHVQANLSCATTAYGVSWNMDNTTADTTLTITAKNVHTATINQAYFIDVEITDA